MPTGCSTSLSFGVLGDDSETTPMRVGRIGTGLFAVISSVYSSTALPVILRSPKDLVRVSQSRPPVPRVLPVFTLVFIVR